MFYHLYNIYVTFIFQFLIILDVYLNIRLNGMFYLTGRINRTLHIMWIFCPMDACNYFSTIFTLLKVLKSKIKGFRLSFVFDNFLSSDSWEEGLRNISSPAIIPRWTANFERISSCEKLVACHSVTMDE